MGCSGQRRNTGGRRWTGHPPQCRRPSHAPPGGAGHRNRSRHDARRVRTVGVGHAGGSVARGLRGRLGRDRDRDRGALDRCADGDPRRLDDHRGGRLPAPRSSRSARRRRRRGSDRTRTSRGQWPDPERDRRLGAANARERSDRYAIDVAGADGGTSPGAARARPPIASAGTEDLPSPWWASTCSSD
jgi:hypothetical protein